MNTFIIYYFFYLIFYYINKIINYKHTVKEKDILQLKGDLCHKPGSTSGFGCRDLIVVFIRRI